MNKWDKRFVALAEHIAGWSKDPSTKVGAVLVGNDRRKVTFGYNGFPPGIADTPDRLSNRDTKLLYTQHAERNALDNALFDTDSATLYCTFFPCCDCAKSIISKGILRVVAPIPSSEQEEKWGESFRTTRMMFVEAGVMVEMY